MREERVTTLVDQLVVVYLHPSKGEQVYATAYRQTTANEQRARCLGRYPDSQARIVANYPPPRSRP